MVKEQSKDIYSLGIACVFLSSFMALFFGIGSYMLYSLTANDAYIAVIVGSLISIATFKFFYYIFSNNNKSNIYELNKDLFGKIFGNILNAMMFLALFIIAVVIFYNISSFLNIEYLPEANTDMVKLLILVSLMYACTKGLPELIRANQIFAIISTAIIAIEIIGSFAEFDISNIEPVLSCDKGNMLLAIGTYVGLSAIPYYMLLITSKKRIKDEQRCKSSLLKVIIFTNFLQVVIALITILILGKSYIKIFRFPEYVALKQFSLFNIFERVENVLSLQYYFTTFSCLSLIFYYLIQIFPNNRLKKYYSVILSLVIFFVTQVCIKDSIQFVSLTTNYIYYVILVCAIAPLLLTFIRLKKCNKKS